MHTHDRMNDGIRAAQFVDGAGRMRVPDHDGARFSRPYRTSDGKTVDSSGAFLVGELERLDLTEHLPLYQTSYSRDLPLRTDVTLGDEVTSFTQSTWAVPGNAGVGSPVGQKRSFIGKETTQIGEVAVDIGKVTLPLVPWGEGLSYSLPELESAAQLGRPIDQQKLNVIDASYQFQLDQQAYLGWQGNNTYGLVNNTSVVTPTNLPNGASGFSQWSKKSGAEILTDLANMVYAPWAATGFKWMPNRIGLDPQNLSLISTIQVSLGTAGIQSVLKYFLDSNIVKNSGQELKIVEMKYLMGAGQGGILGQPGTVNRAIVYRYEDDWKQAPVRFPFLTLQRTPIQFDGIFHRFYKWTRMGVPEFVYPESCQYYDGL